MPLNDGTSSSEPARALSPPQLSGLLDAMIAVGREVRLESVLRRLLECATDLIGARYGALGVLDSEKQRLADFLYVGLSTVDGDSIGALPEGRGLLGELIHDPRPLRLTDLATHRNACGFPANHPPMSSFLGVPVLVRGDVFGNLYLTEKRDQEPFTVADEQLAVALAAIAGVAVENSRLHTSVSELAVIEDRERIARELHDTVIQRIFSIGLALESLGGQPDDPAVAIKMKRAAADLDETVRQIRSTVFNLEDRGDRRPLRRELTELIDEIGDRVGISTSLRFEGDIDAVVGVERHSHVTEHLFAAARDAVIAVGEQSRAENADVLVTVGRELRLHIRAAAMEQDASSADWLLSLRERALAVGGRVFFATDPSGAEIIWTVPLDTETKT